MASVGQSRAALIYRHATQDGDAAIAAGLSSMVEEQRGAPLDELERRTWNARVIHSRLAGDGDSTPLARASRGPRLFR